MPIPLRRVARVLKRTIPLWLHDGALSMSASLAFYAVFSLAPLLIIVTFLVGLVYKGDTVEQVRSQFGAFVNPQAADLVARGLVNAHVTTGANAAYTALAVLVLLAGASAFTHELQSSLDAIWNVHPLRRRQGIRGVVFRRLWTLSFVVGAVILLQISVVVHSSLGAYRPYLDALFPRISILWASMDYGAAFAIILLIFWLSYKLLPHARAPWPDALAGALVATLLFSAGRWVIAFYIARSTLTSVYGAAGSLMFLLAWFYYSSVVYLFGAKLTLVSAHIFGREIETTAQSD